MGKAGKIGTDILQLDSHHWTLEKVDTAMYYTVVATFGNGVLEATIKLRGQKNNNFDGFLDRNSDYKITIDKIDR